MSLLILVFMVGSVVELVCGGLVAGGGEVLLLPPGIHEGIGGVVFVLIWMAIVACGGVSVGCIVHFGEEAR